MNFYLQKAFQVLGHGKWFLKLWVGPYSPLSWWRYSRLFYGSVGGVKRWDGQDPSVVPCRLLATYCSIERLLLRLPRDMLDFTLVYSVSSLCTGW